MDVCTSKVQLLCKNLPLNGGNVLYPSHFIQIEMRLNINGQNVKIFSSTETEVVTTTSASETWDM